MKRVNNKAFVWPKGTTLITGSSILNGIQESKLGNYNAKVRAFPGARVDDFYDYLLPLLKKKPTNIILHAGSNDAPEKSSNDIAQGLLALRDFIQHMVPGVKLYFSCPVLRTDDVKANATLRVLDNYLKTLPNFIENDSVNCDCLGKSGLHLNATGSTCGVFSA